MRPSFAPRLVSESLFGDPALFVPFALERRALLFDAGDTGPLSARDILKISHVFVSHAHMDHFMGFDRLLLLGLGREKNLCVFGPAGFLKNVEGKLSGYLWNLAHRFTNSFSISASEVTEDRIRTRTFSLADAFAPGPVRERALIGGVLLDEPSFTVTAAVLDHGTPCLGFALRERFHVNMLTSELDRMGLLPGPWLSRFKKAIYAGADPETIIAAQEGNGGTRDLALGFLSERIATVSPGQALGYVTDVVWHEENEKKILSLVKGVDHLFIEAAFLDEDSADAAEKYHLTAGQAGRMAGKAGVKHLDVFHFSPRYSDNPLALKNEAVMAFEGGKNC